MENDTVFLREVEPEDASLLLLWENCPTVKRVSGRQENYSLAEINAFIAQSKNVDALQQVRFMICKTEDKFPIGTVDLYDMDFHYRHAGIGVLIKDEANRNKGFASQAINKCIQLGIEKYQIVNYFCVIHKNNLASIKLFEKNGFVQIGVRKNWYYLDGKWEDELMFQRCEIENNEKE